MRIIRHEWAFLDKVIQQEADELEAPPPMFAGRPRSTTNGGSAKNRHSR